MQGRTSIKAVLLAALIAGITLAGAARAQRPQGPRYGPGMMGPGALTMGPGMMGPGVQLGGCEGQQSAHGTRSADMHLSAGDVRGYLQRWTAMMGNTHLKVGPVVEQDADTISAQIVTADNGGVVQRFSIDRRTGIWRVVQ